MNLWRRGGLGCHFLALFPSLLLMLAILRALPGGTALRETMAGSFSKVLPDQAAQLVTYIIGQLSRSEGVRLPVAVLGAVWAERRRWPSSCMPACCTGRWWWQC